MKSEIFRVGFKKTYPFLIALIVIFFLIYILLIKPSRSQKISITLIHTSNINGYLTPSGCMFNPLGGLPYLGTAIKNIIKESKKHLIFDSGDTFFGLHDINLDFEENKRDITFLRKNATAIVDSMNHLGIFASTVGDHDLGAGYDEWINLAKSTNHPIVSINAKDEDNIIKPYIIKKYKGIKILITGITGTYSAAPFFITTDKITISEDYQKSLINLIEKENADLVILLSHSGILFDRILTKEVPNIDIILGAHSMGWAGALTENNTLIVHNGRNGQHISKIEITLTLDKKSNAYTKEIESELISIDPKFLPKDPDIVKIIDKYKAESK